jgi:CRP-like cAMP-binding protein
LSPEAIFKILKGFPYLSALPDELNLKLAALAVPKRFKAGETIFARGEKVTGFHLVSDGKVKIFVSDPSGKERTLKIASQGELFGEAAVFQSDGYPASSSALTASGTYYFPKDAMLRLIGESPDLAFATIGILAARLQLFASLLEGTLKELLPRLADYLLRLPDEGGKVRLPVKKVELARHLGVTAESLSRALGDLKAEGSVVREERSGILVLDRKLLEERAEGL